MNEAHIEMNTDTQSLLEVTINDDFTTVINASLNGRWTIPTAHVFGNVYTTLKKHYPDAEAGVNFWVNNFVDRINGKDGSSFPLFGCREYGKTLAGMNDYINGRESFSPTYQEIENLRESYRMTSAPLHSNLNRKDEITFSDLKAPMEVIVSILYYYLMNKWTLKKCEFCGKWFATARPQTKFCSRKFEYADYEGKKKIYENCKAAKDDIDQRLKKRKKAISEYLQYYSKESDRYRLNIDDFMRKITSFEDEVREKPNIANYRSYEHYLYVDCERLYEKYGRRNRK